MLEIELRAKVDRDEITQQLENAGAQLVSEGDQDDDYFKCAGDEERKLIFRIRKKRGKVLLTLKGSSQHEEDIAWQEWEQEISDPKGLKNIFLSNGYVRVVRVAKHRRTYQLAEAEVNVDEVEGLGTYLEVEIKAEYAGKGRLRIVELLSNLGVMESQLVTEGYVPLMIAAQVKNHK